MLHPPDRVPHCLRRHRRRRHCGRATERMTRGKRERTTKKHRDGVAADWLSDDLTAGRKRRLVAAAPDGAMTKKDRTTRTVAVAVAVAVGWVPPVLRRMGGGASAGAGSTARRVDAAGVVVVAAADCTDAGDVAAAWQWCCC